MQKAHKAYAVTGSIATAAAAKIPGTVVNEVYQPQAGSNLVRIGHSSGRLTLEVFIEPRGDGYVLRRAALQRTARRIMDGYVYVPKSKMGN